MQVGWELVSHGATPEEAFEAIQRLADEAGITLPVDIDVESLTSIERQLEAIAGTAHRVADDARLELGHMGADLQAELSDIAERAADAFKLGQVDDAIAMLAAFEGVLRNSALSTEGQAMAMNHLADEFTKFTGVEGPVSTTFRIRDLESALRDLSGETTSAADRSRTLIQAFLDVRDAGGTTEEALAAMADAAADLASTEEDVEGATGDAADASRDHADAMDEEEGASADLEEQTKNTKSAIEELADAKRAASDPVFALLDAIQGVNDATAAYNDTLDDNGNVTEDSAAAAIDKAKALDRLEQAAVDGALDFDVFAKRLDAWIASGELTASQAAEIRDRVAEARGELERVRGSYEAEVQLDAAKALLALRELGRLLDSVTGRRDVAITGTTQGGHLAGRNHDGGVIDGSSNGGRGGLRPDERLRVGEEVLTSTDPRHVNNLGSGGSASSEMRELARLMSWAVRDGLANIRIEIRGDGSARDFAHAAQIARR